MKINYHNAQHKIRIQSKPEGFSQTEALFVFMRVQRGEGNKKWKRGRKDGKEEEKGESVLTPVNQNLLLSLDP